ncbi:MAG: hypothetical protein WAN05_12100 [Roseiarcus sp.]
MTFSAKQLRGVVNLLADPQQAGNAASILAREAAARGLLVSDLVAQTMASMLASSSPPPSAPPTAPRWQDVESIDDGSPYVKQIDADHIGLVAGVIAETPKAWCAQLPNGLEAWLAKSVVENYGEDASGRAILVVPKWLAKRIGIAA